MKVIILAGGGGTRLFPLSRTNYPKQFLKIDGKESLLAETIKRFLPLAKATDIVIVTNKDYLHHVRAEIKAAKANGAHILLEPIGRNTTPAISLAARFCRDTLASGAEEVLFITPSDHVIKREEEFRIAVRQAADMAMKQRIVTFGIRPNKPEIGYGYIQAGEAFGPGFVVDCFKEKPNAATAKKYLEAGNYYWNSGMFALTLDCLAQELAAYQPEIAELSTQPYEEIVKSFNLMPDISFDYAVAERSSRVVTIPLEVDWNDIGCWDAMYEVLNKDDGGNAVYGDCLMLDCKNTLILGQSRLIAGIGLDDLLVVETDDVILVGKKGESQRVKEVVSQLKAKERREAHEHTTSYRPWGSYTILSDGPGYKMKKIVVDPGQRLSVQLHYHRSEHWIVIGGTARVTIGEKTEMVHENESVFVPQSTKHCLENPGRLPLEIIEVQNGKYLEEDDIVRFDDIYGRA